MPRIRVAPQSTVYLPWRALLRHPITSVKVCLAARRFYFVMDGDQERINQAFERLVEIKGTESAKATLTDQDGEVLWKRDFKA